MYSIRTGEYEILANGSVSFFDSLKPISIAIDGISSKKFQVDFYTQKANIVNSKNPPMPTAKFTGEGKLSINIPYDPSASGEGSTESPIDIGKVGEYSLYLQFTLTVSNSGHLLLFFTFYGKSVNPNNESKPTATKRSKK